MGTNFWIKRFLIILLGAFVIISTAQLLKGRSLPYSTTQGAIWGLITATIFTVGRMYQSRRGQHCAICQDTPEMQKASHGSDS